MSDEKEKPGRGRVVVDIPNGSAERGVVLDLAERVRSAAGQETPVSSLRAISSDAILQAESDPTNVGLLETALDAFEIWARRVNQDHDDPAEVDIGFHRLREVFRQSASTDGVACALFAKLLTNSALCGEKTFMANPREMIEVLLIRAEGLAGKGGAGMVDKVGGIVKKIRSLITPNDSPPADFTGLMNDGSEDPRKLLN